MLLLGSAWVSELSLLLSRDFWIPIFVWVQRGTLLFEMCIV